MAAASAWCPIEGTVVKQSCVGIFNCKGATNITVLMVRMSRRKSTAANPREAVALSRLSRQGSSAPDHSDAGLSGAQSWGGASASSDNSSDEADNPMSDGADNPMSDEADNSMSDEADNSMSDGAGVGSETIIGARGDETVVQIGMEQLGGEDPRDLSSIALGFAREVDLQGELSTSMLAHFRKHVDDVARPNLVVRVLATRIRMSLQRAGQPIPQCVRDAKPWQIESPNNRWRVSTAQAQAA